MGYIKYDCKNNIQRLIIKFDQIKSSSLKFSRKKKNFCVFKENFVFGYFQLEFEKKENVVIFEICTLKNKK